MLGLLVRSGPGEQRGVKSAGDEYDREFGYRRL